MVQKLFEQCTEATKQAMLERIAPYLAAIGVHKNGTWAAQKIIDYANTPTQVIKNKCRKIDVCVCVWCPY